MNTSYVCNGFPDCPRGEDELLCGECVNVSPKYIQVRDTIMDNNATINKHIHFVTIIFIHFHIIFKFIHFPMCPLILISLSTEKPSISPLPPGGRNKTHTCPEFTCLDGSCVPFKSVRQETDLDSSLNDYLHLSVISDCSKVR